MTTVERKEFQETKILRTVSPVRSSNQNLTQFDSNLDYLLEDLQNSVSRPGSSLGNSYRETSRSTTALEPVRSNSLNRVSNVKSSNPVTEYSSDDTYSYASPDGRKQISGYKKETYSYKTSGSDRLGSDKAQVQYNQLDSLLDDLQQVKQSSYNEKESYNSVGTEPNFQKKTTVNRELHYGDTPRSSSRSRTLERHERESSLTRDVQYSNEGTYGDLRQIRTISPTPSSRTSTLSKQTKVTNVKDYPIEVVETTVPGIDPEVLAHLDPNLRPPGNTKVTTTIKTYTYEIPGSGNYPTNLVDSNTSVDEKYVYSPNESQTTTPSRSFVYNKVENKSTENRSYQPSPTWQRKVYKDSTVTDNVNYNYPPYQKPSPPGGSNKTVVKETVTTRNYQPGYSPEILPPSQQTYIYNETTTTKNVNQNGYKPAPPPPQTTYIIKETNRNTINNNVSRYPDDNDRDYPGNWRPSKSPNDVESFDPKHPPYGSGGRPNEPLNIHYKYKSTSSTTNNYKGGYPPNDETQTLLPQRFPTDGEIIDNGGPPKRLDDLMATIGNEPPNSPLNAGYLAHEQELAQQKKIDAFKQQHDSSLDDVQKKEQPIQRTKNVSGPPVYYPPGHEMFAKKEEEANAAWRAEGGYAKASGKYEYEAKSKSKSKSGGGATVVPVCLPLCCGLPCVLL